MNSLKLKEYLLQIADGVNEHTTLEDIYKQLSLLNDIDESAEEEERGEVISHNEVRELSRKWLK
ncbi:MAG: hypothetical protein H6581_23250 [Bacteroidia bacterium]|nr:hypothetical protein [Bacteroidia bacterium]